MKMQHNSSKMFNKKNTPTNHPYILFNLTVNFTYSIRNKKDKASAKEASASYIRIFYTGWTKGLHLLINKKLTTLTNQKQND